jgi:alkylation response protein AidB-like acyl-CoA dehydrogenase
MQVTQPTNLSGCNAATDTLDDSDFQALDEAISQVLASEADRHALHSHIDGKVRLDRMLWDKAVELGWPAIGLPEGVGGLGMGLRGLDLLYRQLGRCVAPGPFLATLAAAQTISEVADAVTKTEWLPRLAAGECKLAVAALVDTTPGGSETWLLGDVDSDAALVPLASGEWGLVSLAGAERLEMWDRTRPLLRLDLAGRQPLATFPGAPTAQALTRNLALGIAADAIGGARAIIEITVSYMMQREQFGRVIASFQALKHRIADHMTEVVSGEEFLSLAVDSAARGNPDADIWAGLAKARCTESYVRIAQDCLQLHGGVGFTWEFDVHLYLNRARLSELLVAPNTKLKDDAVAGLADAVRCGREALELA